MRFTHQLGEADPMGGKHETRRGVAGAIGTGLFQEIGEFRRRSFRREGTVDGER